MRMCDSFHSYMKEMSMAKVTIIVPVYKVEPYLCRCIDSIIGQTFHDFDLVLIDDGSPDRCGAICDSYSAKDRRIHVIHQNNKGLSDARNAGIEWALKNSDSDWISFVDSDDWIHPLYLEFLLSASEMYRTSVVIGGFIRTNGEPLPALAKDTECIHLSKTEDYYIGNNVNATISWGKLYKKSCYSSIRFPSGKCHEDEFITYRILFQYEYVTVVEQPLYAYFQNENGIMKSKWAPRRLDAIEAIEQQVGYFSSNGYIEIAQKRFSFLINKINESKKQIKLIDGITERARKKYLRQTNRRLRRVLIRYRKYRWLPYDKDVESKQLYSEAFITIRIGRNVWRRLKPVHKLIGWKKTYKRLKKLCVYDPDIVSKTIKIKFDPRQKIYMLGTPAHNNLGDHIIALSQEEYFRKYFSGFQYIDCVMPFAVQCLDILNRSIRKKDIICLSGGGWLGTTWRKDELFVRRVLQQFTENPIVILPQTVYYEQDSNFSEEGAEIYRSHPKLLFCLRDKASFDYVISHGFVKKERAFLMPDIALFYKGYKKEKGHRAETINICLRSDREKLLNTQQENTICSIAQSFADIKRFTTISDEKTVRTDQRKAAVFSKLDEVSNGRLLITDRLHAMILATITGTPCLAFDNLTHKVSGVYEWIKHLDYIQLAGEEENLREQIHNLYFMKPQEPLKGLEFLEYEKGLYERIIELAKE